MDCPPAEVCYVDARCLPSSAARQLGASVGDECQHQDGVVSGCAFTCLMGFCDGPPEFAGAAAAVSDGPTALVVRWDPPSDETGPDDLIYRIYVSTAPGEQDLATPTLVTTGGASARLDGLTTDTAHYVLIRVEDQYGQREENLREVRGVPGCVDYAAQVEPLLARCQGCHGEERSERGLRLDSLAALHAGVPGRPVIVACRAEQSRLVQRAGDPPPLDTRGPHGGLSPEELDLVGAWIDAGAQESCPVDRAICADATAPSFDGLVSVTPVSPSTVTLCWDPATDDRTSVDGLIYDVYEATPGGGPVVTSLPGETCVTVPGQVPGRRSCWLVQARDGAGNVDGNAVEQCATMPDAECVEYGEVIQPIFDARCIHCHGGDAPLLRLRLTDYEGVIAGGASGEIAPACDPDGSLLLSRLGADPPRGIRMPGDGPPFLGDAQLGVMRRWLAEGARASCGEPDPC